MPLASVSDICAQDNVANDDALSNRFAGLSGKADDDTDEDSDDDDDLPQCPQERPQEATATRQTVEQLMAEQIE